MYKRLLYIFSLALALTSSTLPAQAAPDIDIDEDVVEEPAKATAYRYWIDDNTNKTVASFNGEDIESNIDVSNLTIGVHTYHIQLRDQYGRWGITKDIPFYAGYQSTEVKEEDTESPVEKIVYWFDDDYNNKVTLPYTQADISFEKDITNEAGGSHTYSVIAFNSQNRAASATGTYYLPTTSEDDSGETEVTTIVAYQYWVDDDKANAKTLAYTSGDISQAIDYTQLAEGAHTLNFRMKNNEGIWSQKYQYAFYTPTTNSSEEAETSQPITGYRYGVNGKSTTIDLTEVDNVPTLSVDIAFPTAQEFAKVEDYEFTTDNASREVKVKRNGDLTYYIQFKNKLGQWGEPVFLDSLASDSTIRTAKELTLQRTLGIRKLGKGDYDIAKFTIDNNNGYYFGASSSCSVMLYQDNQRLSTFTPEQMLNNKSTLLAPGTYFAIIYNQDEDGSIRLTGSNNWVSTPTFSYDSSHQLSISSETAGATIHYTLDGTMPTAESEIYTGPLTMSQNTRVKALACADGMSDSFIESYLVGDFDPLTCAEPQATYDGRKVTLTTSSKNADIYYTLDGSDPTTSSQLYNIDAGIAVNEAGTIKAFATMDLMNDSPVTTYNVPSYYDGNDRVSVKTAGSLATAFEWCDGKPQRDTLNVTGNINAADFATLARMSNLKLLDMNAATVEGNTIADQALAGMNIASASLPATLTTCGGEIFANCPKLAAVMWNSNSAIPANTLDGINNPNLLLYVNAKSAAPAGINNVIASGVAENVVLAAPTDGSEGNFFCPQAFTAQKISYTRNFNQETEVGVCQGWETLSLPFDVQTITHETNGTIAPFAKGDNTAKPFWLYELSPEAGFQAASSIKAYTPYIISMPNSQAYSDEYILGGKVTFTASNVRVAATTAASSKNSNREFATSFEQVPAQDGIYALNVGTEYQGYRPGSIFAENFMVVKPFEAYLTTAEAAQAFSLKFGGGTTGIENIPVKEINGVKAWANGSTLYIQSDKARKVQVFSTMGILMKTIETEAGETATVTDLPAGIYIVNNKKVAVK